MFRTIVSTLLMVTTSSAFMSSTSTLRQSSMTSINMINENNIQGDMSRRDIFKLITAVPATVAATSTLFPLVSNAIPEGTKVTGADDGNLPDLPPEAAKSYLQYRISFQVAMDYYLFELQSKLGNIDDWGEVNQLFQTKNNRGQGQPNKIERDYTNTMRILSLSMPPDESESMRAAQFKFEKAMQQITKATSGVRRDLPVEIDPSQITKAQQGWEDGRVALNEFMAILNEATGLNEMKLIPDAGPDQFKRYGRSPRRYFELTKKTKLCQNRGGPALSQAWGQLMISGYLQENMDSCGSEFFYYFVGTDFYFLFLLIFVLTKSLCLCFLTVPDPVEYFYQ